MAHRRSTFSATPARWCCGCGASADLRFACLRSVSVVGARAATGYGNARRHRDGCGAGRAGLDGRSPAGPSASTAVRTAARSAAAGSRSPCWPAGSATATRRAITSSSPRSPAQGVMVSEWPPGPHAHQARVPGPQPGDRRAQPRHGRGGGGAAQRRAEHRPARARPVPPADGRARAGDLELSAGCHEIIREWGAVCVTGAQDVMEHRFPGRRSRRSRARGPVPPRDALDPVTPRCWRPSRPGRGAARPAIAVTAGVDLTRPCAASARSPPLASSSGAPGAGGCERTA